MLCKIEIDHFKTLIQLNLDVFDVFDIDFEYEQIVYVNNDVIFFVFRNKNIVIEFNNIEIEFFEIKM